GQDLAEGIYTLPVLLALADGGAGPELRTLLGRPLDLPEREKARAIISESSAVPTTVAVARQHADEAAAATIGVRSAAVAGALVRLTESLLDGLPG
ncbi:MAG: hypothetical protein ACRDYZ_05680, partial [Acidimicrobiales bacterium]